MSETLDYYNKHADIFYETTVHSDMSEQYGKFLKYLRPEAQILDLGCGSGRDSKYFLEQGYRVTSLDGSVKLCEKASRLTGQEVICMKFHEMSYENKFDGIWACASLLHVEENELVDIFCKLRKALRKNGILYCSFKYGEEAGQRNGRYFTDMTEEKISALIEGIDALTIEQMYTTEDVRPDHKNEMWLNIIIKNE